MKMQEWNEMRSEARRASDRNKKWCTFNWKYALDVYVCVCGCVAVYYVNAEKSSKLTHANEHEEN